MRRVAVIPARWASVRFPGKPLADRTGRPLVVHVMEQANRAASVDLVAVATDDARIADAVRAHGGRAVMTRSDHENGTSRLAEAADHLGLGDDDLVVNVQGDEPEIDPGVIDLAVEALLARPDCAVGTVASPFSEGEDPADPNLVKVVLDVAGRALYFSRALIPHARADAGEPQPPLRHVGLYVYRRRFLRRFADLAPTPLERTERLEQLRVLEHGERIAVAVAGTSHHGIDTPEQYEAFVRRVAARGADLG